jgi:hypothetical protein
LKLQPLSGYLISAYRSIGYLTDKPSFYRNMKQFKKALRLTGLVLLILLASVGLGGGVPIPPPNRKENHIEIKIELKETEDQEKLTLSAIRE